MKVTHFSTHTHLVCDTVIQGLTVDVLLAYCARTVSMKKSELMRHCFIQPSEASRIRRGKKAVPDIWILRIHEYTGIPISDLRAISNTRPYKYIESKYDTNRARGGVLQTD